MARLSSGEGLALLKRPLKFKRGDKGPFIVDIQAMFAKLGFDPGEPEGVFVAKTEDAVRVFQSEYGLPVTGIIDAKTLKLLYEEADPEGYPAALIEGEAMDPEEQEGSQGGAEDHEVSHGGPENREISRGGLEDGEGSNGELENGEIPHGGSRNRKRFHSGAKHRGVSHGRPEEREISYGRAENRKSLHCGPEDRQIFDGERENNEISYGNEKSGQISTDEESGADEEAIAEEGFTSDEEFMDDQGLADDHGSTAAEGLIGNHGLVEDHGPVADLELTVHQGPVEDHLPVTDQGLAGDQGLTEGHESVVDQGLAGDQGPIDVQGSLADKGITDDEQSVASLAEARPDMTTMATGATDHAIVISLSERTLGLYQGNQLVRRYPVAIGKPSTPTPVGTHRVLEKVLYPGGGLGTRWIGFTYQMHGIHGTNRPELIGQEVSNGCVRMHNANVEELYEMVGVGTPVVVIVAPVQSWSGLGKPTSQTGTGLGPAGTGPGQAGKPGGLLDPSSPQPKDPKGISQTPSPTGGASSGSAQGRTYTVQPGDSIWAIARRFGTTVDAIVRVNGIRNPELIYPGEVLKIP
jgi:lipoprotein-anchoring transpeptidase ErfK/SrfK